MPLRRLLAPIAVFLLGVITCLPTGVHAAGLVKSGDSPDNRISIQEITATYENEGISGTTLIQNGMDSSVAGASIQVTIDQQPDGSATQRVASKILPDPFTLPGNKQAQYSFAFTADELGGLRDGKAIVGIYVRTAGDAILAFHVRYIDVSGIVATPDVGFSIGATKLMVDGKEKESFDRTNVTGGATLLLQTKALNRGTTAATVTPVLTSYRTRESYSRQPLTTKKLDSLTLAGKEEKSLSYEIKAPSQGGTYVYYLALQNSDGKTVSTREGYQINVAGPTADIASISTGIAASTWTFSYKLPIAVTLNGPFTSDTLDGATLSVELMDGGTVISTTTRSLPSITNSGLTEEIVVNTTKKTLAGSLSTKVTLLKDGEVIDTLSTPLRPTLDTAGAQNKLAILGGTILALLVLLAALIWIISRKKKSNARTYIPLMLAAGLSFFLGYQVVQASHGVYSGSPYWGQVLIHGGGTVPLEADHCEDEECSETTRGKVGSYTASPTDACIEARYATSDKGIHVGAPNGWVGPDGEGGTGDDIKASECDTPENGGNPGEAVACAVVYEDLDIPEYITPLLRGLFANGTAVSGTYSGSAGPGNQYKIGSAGVGGIAGTGPEDPRDFFKCSEVAIGPEGANSFSSSCGGWYPSQISVGFSLKKVSCTENCGGPGMSYFYGGPKADLEVDTMETESPGCKEGETIHCTHNWVYPPIDCDGDGTIGEGIGSGTSGESSVGSGFSSIQAGISSISTTVSTISSSISNPGSDPTSDPGSDPSTSDPGSDPSTSDPGSDPSTSDPGSDPSTSDPGSDPSTSDPGSDPSTSDPGSDPSTSDPGSDPSTSDPGSDPSTSDPGSDPSTSDPGSDPTSDPGSDPSTPGTTTGNGKVLNFGLGSRRW